ncbi:hypothetical protein DFH09DRAFT_1219177 [Mycena vulgaris]|nr:hypothetical protein DFH09DRAFT_1219177 [Mycena vulgaris]
MNQWCRSNFVVIVLPGFRVAGHLVPQVKKWAGCCLSRLLRTRGFNLKGGASGAERELKTNTELLGKSCLINDPYRDFFTACRGGA